MYYHEGGKFPNELDESQMQGYEAIIFVNNKDYLVGLDEKQCKKTLELKDDGKFMLCPFNKDYIDALVGNVDASYYNGKLVQFNLILYYLSIIDDAYMNNLFEKNFNALYLLKNTYKQKISQLNKLITKNIKSPNIFIDRLSVLSTEIDKVPDYLRFINDIGDEVQEIEDIFIERNQKKTDLLHKISKFDKYTTIYTDIQKSINKLFDHKIKKYNEQLDIINQTIEKLNNEYIFLSPNIPKFNQLPSKDRNVVHEFYNYLLSNISTLLPTEKNTSMQISQYMFKNIKGTNYKNKYIFILNKIKDYGTKLCSKYSLLCYIFDTAQITIKQDTVFDLDYLPYYSFSHDNEEKLSLDDAKNIGIYYLAEKYKKTTYKFVIPKDHHSGIIDQLISGNETPSYCLYFLNYILQKNGKQEYTRNLFTESKNLIENHFKYKQFKVVYSQHGNNPNIHKIEDVNEINLEYLGLNCLDMFGDVKTMDDFDTLSARIRLDGIFVGDGVVINNLVDNFYNDIVIYGQTTMMQTSMVGNQYRKRKKEILELKDQTSKLMIYNYLLKDTGLQISQYLFTKLDLNFDAKQEAYISKIKNKLNEVKLEYCDEEKGNIYFCEALKDIDSQFKNVNMEILEYLPVLSNKKDFSLKNAKKIMTQVIGNHIMESYKKTNLFKLIELKFTDNILIDVIKNIKADDPTYCLLFFNFLLDKKNMNVFSKEIFQESNDPFLQNIQKLVYNEYINSIINKSKTYQDRNTYSHYDDLTVKNVRHDIFFKLYDRCNTIKRIGDQNVFNQFSTKVKSGTYFNYLPNTASVNNKYQDELNKEINEIKKQLIQYGDQYKNNIVYNENVYNVRYNTLFDNPEIIDDILLFNYLLRNTNSQISQYMFIEIPDMKTDLKINTDLNSIIQHLDIECKKYPLSKIFCNRVSTFNTGYEQYFSDNPQFLQYIPFLSNDDASFNEEEKKKINEYLSKNHLINDMFRLLKELPKAFNDINKGKIQITIEQITDIVNTLNSDADIKDPTYCFVLFNYIIFKTHGNYNNPEMTDFKKLEEKIIVEPMLDRWGDVNLINALITLYGNSFDVVNEELKTNVYPVKLCNNYLTFMGNRDIIEPIHDKQKTTKKYISLFSKSDKVTDETIRVRLIEKEKEEKEKQQETQEQSNKIDIKVNEFKQLFPRASQYSVREIKNTGTYEIYDKKALNDCLKLYNYISRLDIFRNLYDPPKISPLFDKNMTETDLKQIKKVIKFSRVKIAPDKTNDPTLNAIYILINCVKDVTKLDLDEIKKSLK